MDNEKNKEGWMSVRGVRTSRRRVKSVWGWSLGTIDASHRYRVFEQGSLEQDATLLQLLVDYG